MYKVFVLILAVFVFTLPNISFAETWVAFVPGKTKCPERPEGGCNSMYAIGWGFETKEAALKATINECKRRNGVGCGSWPTDVRQVNCISIFGGYGLGDEYFHLPGFGNTQDEAKYNAIKEECERGFKNCRHVMTRCAE